jgi:hypothetical protein
LVASLANRLDLKAVKPPFDPGIDEQFLFYPVTAERDPGARWFRSALLAVTAEPGRRQ